MTARDLGAAATAHTVSLDRYLTVVNELADERFARVAMEGRLAEAERLLAGLLPDADGRPPAHWGETRDKARAFLASPPAAAEGES